MNPGRVNIVTKSSRLPSYCDDASFLAKRCIQLFKDTKINYGDVRGMGVQMEMLNNQSQSTTKKTKHTPTALGAVQSSGKFLCLCKFSNYPCSHSDEANKFLSCWQ